MHTGSDRQTMDANGDLGLGGGVHVMSQEKSLISGSSLLPLKHLKNGLYIPVPPLPILMDTHCFLLLLLFGGGGGGGARPHQPPPGCYTVPMCTFPGMWREILNYILDDGTLITPSCARSL